MASKTYSMAPSASGDGRRNNPGNPNQPRDEKGQFISKDEAGRRGGKGGSEKSGR